MPERNIKKRLLFSVALSVWLALLTGYASAALPTGNQILPGNTNPDGSTPSTTTNPLGTGQLIKTLPPREFSTAVTIPKAPDISIMHTITSATLPPFSDYISAENFAANPANFCTSTTTLKVCAVKATVAGIGATTVSLPICPLNFIPVYAFGSSVYSPAGPLYYSQFHRTAVSYDQFLYYSARNYSCGADWFINNGQGVRTTVYATDYNTYYGLFTSDLNSSNLVGGAYYYKKYGNFTWFFNFDPNGPFVNLSEKYLYTICERYKDPNHVPASCAGIHEPDGSITPTYQLSYMIYVTFPWYCTRNAGYYPLVSNPPYPFAAYDPTFAPQGQSPTTTICGKAYNTFTAKP